LPGNLPDNHIEHTSQRPGEEGQEEYQ
jgi:hypothetical protein